LQTARPAGDDHPIADGDRAHGRPYLHDRSNSFVAEDAAGLHGWHVALEEWRSVPQIVVVSMRATMSVGC
jgi:hypothetical protein